MRYPGSLGQERLPGWVYMGLELSSPYSCPAERACEPYWLSAPVINGQSFQVGGGGEGEQRGDEVSHAGTRIGCVLLKTTQNLTPRTCLCPQQHNNSSGRLGHNKR